VDPIDWLLASDPAIRWQAMRDLTDAPAAAIDAERARITHEGLGAGIVNCQESDGSWRRGNGPLWLSTLFTLLLLRATGVDPAVAVVKSAMARLEEGLRWNDQDGRWELRPPETGGNTFFEGEVEPCINGGALAIGAYFVRPMKSLVDRLVREQLDDGGWNCDAPKSRCSSFHTTICVLEGLLEYEDAVGGASKVAAARRRGQEYLLERSLFRRRSTGEVANPEFLELAFPPRYHYDVLRALDYFRNAAIHDNVEPDLRICDAVRLVKSKSQADGRWLLDRAYDEALALPFGESMGEPSRWNTLRAMRVLRWYEQEPS
jgi:hypothetical protein